jgi:cytochrome c-type biogenesis protein CcmF
MARHRKSDENYFVALTSLIARNRRRYGGYVIHLGVVFMAIGIIGISLFQTETQGTITQGQSLTLSGYTMTFKDLAEFDTADGRMVTRAVVDVSKDGKILAELHPRRDYYIESQQPMTIPGVRSTIEDDFYVLLVDWQPISSAGATFKIYHNPLVNWLWFGGFIFILGTLIAAWPDKDPEEVREKARRASLASARA